MASASASAAASSSSAQHIDVDIEEDVRAGVSDEAKDEDMGGDVTPAAEGADTPQSIDSDLATSFYQTSSTKKRPTGSKLAADTEATVVDDDDDMMEPELPSREERVGDHDLDTLSYLLSHMQHR